MKNIVQKFLATQKYLLIKRMITGFANIAIFVDLRINIIYIYKVPITVKLR